MQSGWTGAVARSLPVPGADGNATPWLARSLLPAVVDSARSAATGCDPL